jgi:hypothetical protein
MRSPTTVEDCCWTSWTGVSTEVLVLGEICATRRGALAINCQQAELNHLRALQ